MMSDNAVEYPSPAKTTKPVPMASTGPIPPGEIGSADTRLIKEVMSAASQILILAEIETTSR